MSPVSEMAHQRTGTSVRMIIFVRRKSIIDQNRRCTSALGQHFRKRFDESTSMNMHFRLITDRQIHMVGNALPDGIDKRFFTWNIREYQPIVMNRYARFVPSAPVLFDQMNRHRVQHFIGEHHSVKSLWQNCQPLDIVESFQGYLLPLAQFGRQFQNPVFSDPDTGPGQSGQNIERQLSRSCAQFKNVRRPSVQAKGSLPVPEYDRINPSFQEPS